MTREFSSRRKRKTDTMSTLCESHHLYSEGFLYEKEIAILCKKVRFFVCHENMKIISYEFSFEYRWEILSFIRLSEGIREFY